MYRLLRLSAVLSLFTSSFCRLEAADYQFSTQNNPQTSQNTIASMELDLDQTLSLQQHPPTDENIQKYLAENLQNCSLALQRKSVSSSKNNQKNSTHYYKIYCQGVEVYKAELMVHRFATKLNFIRAVYPVAPLDTDIYNFKDPRDLLPSVKMQNQQQVLYEYGSRLNAAWKISFYDRFMQKPMMWIIDANTGKIFEKIQKSLKADYFGDVFINNQNDHLLIEKPLPELFTTGKLDGPYFNIFSSEDGNNRISAIGNNFVTQNNSTSDLDQVQAYYAATQVMQWWKNEFSYQPKNFPIQIHVFHSNGGSANNAYYSPFDESGSPSIRIGKGDQINFNYLSRDNDVLRHELQHHFFFDFFLGENDEQIMMHEFLADFFTYSMTEDPSLAESIQKNGQPLRTAILPSTAKVDDTGIPTSAHSLSQYLSASMWNLKNSIPDVHQLLYSSMRYMPQSAGLKDLFSAILLADRDLFPLANDNEEHESFGQNKCIIVSSLVDRGFARYLADIDTISCNIDIASLAEKSIQNKANLFLSGADDGDEESGGGCGVVTNHHHTSPIPGSLLIIFAPFIVGLLHLKKIIVKERNTVRRPLT